MKLFLIIFSAISFRFVLGAVPTTKILYVNNTRYVEGYLVHERGGFNINNLHRIININTACQNKAPGGYCSDDCGTFYVCVGVTKPSDIFKCSEFNDRNTPYCWDDKCQSEQDVTNKNCGSSFSCTAVGTFPEPTNCSRYRVCRFVGIEGDLHECPDGLVYDIRAKLCRAKRSSKDCATFDCKKKFNEFVKHPLHHAYYAYCVTPPNRQIKHRVFKCKDDVNYAFDTVTKKCEFVCKRRGEFVDREDCESYVSCRWEHGKYLWERIKCPFGHYFRDNKCVSYPANTTQRCTPEIIPPPPVNLPPTGGNV